MGAESTIIYKQCLSEGKKASTGLQNKWLCLSCIWCKLC